MRRVNRATVGGVSCLLITFSCLLITMALGVPVFGQVSCADARGAAVGTPCQSLQTTDFAGEWLDFSQEIGAGAELYDYSGLPVNAAGRMRFDSGDISDWSIPEFVCRPHPGVYNWYYAGGLRIVKENDPITRELIAFHILFYRGSDRPIYMDGRPHPPAWAPHTWAGFSTGKFVGNTLVITTTHLKESYLRPNTALFSDKSTVTEYLMLDGDIMTVTTLLQDPVYMDAPHLQSTSYRRAPHAELPYFPCTVVVENIAEGFPHFLPGKNPYLSEGAKALKLPLEAVRGGVETLYPEYREKLKNLPIVASK
jgi:hypothetical protein